MSGSGNVCRWGILSTASIGRKNWKAIRNAENATLVAVASRDSARAAEFIDECQAECPFDPAPQAVATYQELLDRADIDAVYVPLPTGLRREWVVKAACAGKHVICEKPCGVNADQVREMIDVCRENNVQFMDGVMYMHSNRMQRLREVLDSGEIGQLRRITSAFSFCGPDEFLRGNIRVNSSLEPQGCVGDLGWYTIRFALWTMNYQLPQRVAGRLLTQHGRDDSPVPVPLEFSGELFFADGVSSAFYNSFLNEHQQWVVLSGSKGFVHIPDFVLPFYGNEVAFDVSNAVFHVEGCEFHMENHTRRIGIPEYSDADPTAQETNLFRNFSRLALSGTPDTKWSDIALKTQQVMDACLESARSDGRIIELA